MFKIVYLLLTLPPTSFEKKGHIVLHLSVGWSVCRPSNVCSVFWPPFPESCQTWNLGCPLGEMTPIDFQVIWSKVKVKLQVLVQMMFAQYVMIPLRYGPKGPKFWLKKPLIFFRLFVYEIHSIINFVCTKTVDF